MYTPSYTCHCVYKVLYNGLNEVQASYNNIHGPHGWAIEAWIDAHSDDNANATHSSSSSSSSSSSNEKNTAEGRARGQGIDASRYAPISVEYLPTIIQKWLFNYQEQRPFTLRDIQTQLIAFNNNSNFIDYQKFIFLMIKLNHIAVGHVSTGTDTDTGTKSI